MESKIDELKELGIDLTSIIKGTSNEKLLAEFAKSPIYGDRVIPEWTEDDIIAFSNRIYNIVTKYGGR